MNNERPNPDDLLKQLQGSEARARRGRLKVFFGYAAGVGKTYAMLSAAQRERARGVDVVAGYVESHGRRETESLLQGLESIPAVQVPYRGVTVSEFDLDAALARRPQLMLVDELAHSNAEGLRHAKRWQDIEELRDAGIDVWTTCNVQHVESLNDVVAKVSGVIIRETVPDDVFARADEMFLVDLPPEDLLERLRQGKVYLPRQAEKALDNFFTKENLVALREMALRRTAEHVHLDVETARTRNGSQGAWETLECLLVCVSPSPTSAKVIRVAKRLATALQAELVAIHVDTAGTDSLARGNRDRLLSNMRLAERLGAETVMLVGEDPVFTTLDYARCRNVTKIVIGKSDAVRSRFWRRPTLTDRLIHDSGEIDVIVIRGTEEGLPNKPQSFPSRKNSVRAWFGTIGILGLCTASAWFLDWLWTGLKEANIAMTFLLGVVFISARYGLWPSVVSSMLAVILFDVLFTQPYYTVVVNDRQSIVTFAIMLVVGLITVTLTNRIQRQAELARRNERRTEALYRLSRKLAGIVGHEFLIPEAERAVSQVFGGEAVFFVPQNGKLSPILGHRGSFAGSPSEVAVAQWVLDHSEIAGRDTATLPAAEAVYFPLSSPHGTIAVLGIQRDQVADLLLPESRSLLDAYTTLIALALERDRLTLEGQIAHVKAETQELRSTLLASVSHDVRTPLAVIAGASSTLLHEPLHGIDDTTRHELLMTIFEESDRLSRLVENLLRLTQFSAGGVHINKDWHPVEEVVGVALQRLERGLSDHPVTVDLPAELLLGHFDDILIQQVLINLLENAARYTPSGTPIEINGRPTASGIILEVADRGPGLAEDELEAVFELFQRGRKVRSDSRGAGLGLAICQAIVKAHGGKITAQNRRGGGALFRLTLPSEGTRPSVDQKIHEEAS